MTRRAIRDALVAAVVILGTLVVLVFWQSRGARPVPGAGPAKVAQLLPKKTPVLRRSGPLWPRALKRWLRVRKAEVEAPPAAEPPPGAAEEARAADEAEKAAREAARREDEERRRAARAEITKLQEYADLLPARDAGYYRFLLGKFSEFSEVELDRRDNLEGVFLNRSFFAAGSWGKNPELHRAWVYLLRALGIDAGEEREKGVLALTDSIFQKGMQETREIETAVFGAPLEGGDPWYWEEVGYPPLEDCQVAWEARNDAYVALWWELLDGLERLLAQEDFERVREFFELCNLKT